MQNGHTKNIDQQVANKFNAFKEYAKKYNLKGYDYYCYINFQLIYSYVSLEVTE